MPAPIAIAKLDSPEPSATETAAAEKVIIGFEEIAKLADSYWEARGCQGGLPEEDWFQAERELRKTTTPWIIPAEKAGVES